MLRVGWVRGHWDLYMEVLTQEVARYYQCLLVTAFQLLTMEGPAALASYSLHNVSLLASLEQSAADLLWRLLPPRCDVELALSAL